MNGKNRSRKKREGMRERSRNHLKLKEFSSPP
jgi:hypothetical protein